MQQGKPIRKKKLNESLDELFQRSQKIRSSSDFKKMLEFLTKFKNYKPYNNYLVYVQNPNCELYATAADWKKRFDRFPKQDARPMVILAPMSPVLFVYDLEETEGEAIPELLQNPFTATGYAPPALLTNITSYFAELQIALKLESHKKSSAGRIVRIDGKSRFDIVLNKSHPELVQLATLIHELAHLFLGHLGSLENEQFPLRSEELLRNITAEEIEAEAVSYIVLSQFDIETNADEYIAIYGAVAKDYAMISMDLILKTSSKLEEMLSRPFKPRVK